jgi:hypothetical protein
MELASEIWKKLLGTVSLETDRLPPVRPGEWSIDAAPERDGRVIWLIAQIGGLEAIGHRYEDIQRERYGRSIKGVGRPHTQPVEEDESGEMGVDPDQSNALEKTDSHRAWRGLLAMAAVDFRPDDDVTMLLNLLAADPGILDDSSSGQWPVKLIVARLNDPLTSHRWNEDRVDNAKRRLMNWIERFRKRNRLDGTDLEGLFAGVARQLEGSERKPPPQRNGPHRLN